VEQALFATLATLAVGGALATVAFANPLRCAFALLLTLFALAGLYVTLVAHFLAAMQILVYAGAIMVLFVFVIMLFDLRAEEQSERAVTAEYAVAGLCVLLLVGKFAKVVVAWQPGMTQSAGSADLEFGTIERIAEILFRQFLAPFEMISLLLLVAVIGAVVIARQRFWRERP
jgi:NADH-quinone oxidoreductase subunit J